MYDESDEEVSRLPRPNTSSLDSTTSGGSNESSPVIGRSRIHRHGRPSHIIPETSDSDSSDSSICLIRKRHRPARMESDSESDSSGSVLHRPKKVTRLASDSDSDEWETDDETNNKLNTDSDSSCDNQSEKCPICLLSFKRQEIGTPESCDHRFCFDCLTEWSKNMNTCPVDRQPYNIIFVRKKFNGKIVRKVSVDKPSPQPFETSVGEMVISIEDLTFCTICGASTDEDVMLLCDSCNGGYHLYCLTPPLDAVPSGSWYCDECGPSIVLNHNWPSTLINRLPRTRRTERIRLQIATNRQNQATRIRKRKTKKRNGVKVRRKKCKKGKAKKVARKSVRGRLADQLGIVVPRDKIPQNLPDVRTSRPTAHSDIGIAPLDLFGSSNRLDYYSPMEEDDMEESGNGNVLVRRGRLPTYGDVAIMRRIANKKATILIPTPSSTSTDLLDSILDSQTKLYSKSTRFSLDKTGKFIMTQNNNNYLDLNNVNAPIGKQTPSEYPNRTPNNTNVLASNVNSDANNSSVDNHSTPTSTVETGGNSTQDRATDDMPQDYTQRTLCSVYEQESDEKHCTEPTNSASESDVDIYSDIETVSTSKVEEQSPKPAANANECNSDDENDDSDSNMVIDTDKAELEKQQEENAKEETTVSSTVVETDVPTSSTIDTSMELQWDAVQSTEKVEDDENDEEEDSEDGCPNFSIYSKESINMAKNTDISLESVSETKDNQVEEVSSSPSVKNVVNEQSNAVITSNTNRISSGLYSDSEDESVVKKDTKSFEISDIRNMTEDISEEERSYTPCLDERMATLNREGLDGLDTEMISDEDRNDFDESQELKTVSDGDALEINAKESEIDFTRPEDFEEGEIVDKLKAAKKLEMEQKQNDEMNANQLDEKNVNKENENQNKESFKKLSKSNKERNYRDREKERSKSRDKKVSNEKLLKKKKEKRKEIERYDVRAIINPRRSVKDRFGRDVCLKNNSVTPPHRSQSKERKKRRNTVRSRSKSRNRRSNTRSRSYTPDRKRSRSKNKKRKRSPSPKKRKSRDRSKGRKKVRSRSRRRTRTASPPRRKREWQRRESRDWTLSLSRSPTPEIRHVSPSWTPPNPQTVKPHNLTVILNNDSTRKKKEKKKKSEKKSKEQTEVRVRKRRHGERTPPPSKEVFASGDNILVSVSFNKENETRDVKTTRERRKKETVVEEVEAPPPKKQKKEKKQKKKKDLSTVKPVAIIDLERSPFKELTPSPKDIIVLSDSDNGESNVQKVICDSSQQVASPNSYGIGPKTPPEPQVKFLLTAKPPTLRAINNPLHEPDDMETNDDVTEERTNDYKGPNTPPEPPNSPPSSPDAYDPFEPTKSRSPSPEQQTNQTATVSDDTREDSTMETRLEEKSGTQTTDVRQSLTPPVADVQPADSQSSIQATTPESNVTKSPSGQVAPPSVTQSKPITQPTPFSSVATAMITTAPICSNITSNRINIISTNLITPPTMAQRAVLPNTVKVSPSKAAVKAQTPVKLAKGATTCRKNRSQNGDESSNMELDSPYSPGSSDYEDLFEPPAEKPKQVQAAATKAVKSPTKIQSTFDALFGSPIYGKSKTKCENKGNKFVPVKKPISPTKGGSKQIGVKLDEDNLKILDELPNSAVEMQVKDKFLKKLNRQERVVEEVKLVLKPHYNKKRINKDEYKDILRRAVPKICHNKSGEINPTKIKNLIEAYVKKIRHSKKVTSSSSSVNPQKA